MSHSDVIVLAVFCAVLVTAAITGIALVAGRRLRRRLFAGPQRRAWDLTRADLSQADQQRVVWCTAFRRPVSRGYLAPAQLVYTRYVEYTAERSPARQPRFRFGLRASLLTG